MKQPNRCKGCGTIFNMRTKNICEKCCNRTAPSIVSSDIKHYLPTAGRAKDIANVMLNNKYLKMRII